jgi:hypothetical protein
MTHDDLQADLQLFPGGCRRRHALRRLLAGELEGTAATEQQQHLASCAHCQATVAELEREDREVRDRLPLQRLQQPEGATVLRPWRWARRAVPGVGLALAAGLALFIVARPTPPEHNATKGGLALDVFVGGIGEPRHVDAQEIALGPGERLRLGVNGNGRQYVAVISVDEGGAVSPIYFGGDASLPLGPGHQELPQSIAFDGRGRERLIVLFSQMPLTRGAVEQAAHEAFARAQGLPHMEHLALPGAVDELDRTVLKPEAR